MKKIIICVICLGAAFLFQCRTYLFAQENGLELYAGGQKFTSMKDYQSYRKELMRLDLMNEIVEKQVILGEDGSKEIVLIRQGDLIGPMQEMTADQAEEVALPQGVDPLKSISVEETMSEGLKHFNSPLSATANLLNQEELETVLRDTIEDTEDPLLLMFDQKDMKVMNLPLSVEPDGRSSNVEGK